MTLRLQLHVEAWYRFVILSLIAVGVYAGYGQYYSAPSMSDRSSVAYHGVPSEAPWTIANPPSSSKSLHSTWSLWSSGGNYFTCVARSLCVCVWCILRGYVYTSVKWDGVCWKSATISYKQREETAKGMFCWARGSIASPTKIHLERFWIGCKLYCTCSITVHNFVCTSNKIHLRKT
jgi:hypothetical protein